MFKEIEESTQLCPHLQGAYWEPVVRISRDYQLLSLENEKYHLGLVPIQAAITQTTQKYGISAFAAYRHDDVQRIIAAALEPEAPLGQLGLEIAEAEIRKQLGRTADIVLARNETREALRTHVAGFRFHQSPIAQEHPLGETNGTGVPFKAFIIYGALGEIVWCLLPEKMPNSERQQLKTALSKQLITVSQGEPVHTFQRTYYQLGLNINGCYGSFAQA